MDWVKAGNDLAQMMTSGSDHYRQMKAHFPKDHPLLLEAVYQANRLQAFTEEFFPAHYKQWKSSTQKTRGKNARKFKALLDDDSEEVGSDEEMDVAVASSEEESDDPPPKRQKTSHSSSSRPLTRASSSKSKRVPQVVPPKPKVPSLKHKDKGKGKAIVVSSDEEDDGQYEDESDEDDSSSSESGSLPV